MLKFYKNYQKVYALRGDAKPGCLLFAEGDTEALFLEKWLDTLDHDPNDIAVICSKGGNNLGAVFKNLSGDENFPNVERFGFFLDAEGNPAHQKATMVTGLLKGFSIIPQNHQIVAGILSQLGNRRIAVFVSPDNANPGSIEHAVMNEVATNKLFPCIDAFRHCTEGILGGQADPKSLIQAYISAYRPRLCGIGRGFQSGVLDVMHDAYTPVRDTISTVL